MESAKIDGAGHFRILLQVILPLSKAGVVTIALFYALQYWNDFYLPLMLINKDNLFSIQYILYKMMSNIQYLASNPTGAMASHVILPTQTIKWLLPALQSGRLYYVTLLYRSIFVKRGNGRCIKG